MNRDRRDHSKQRFTISVTFSDGRKPTRWALPSGDPPEILNLDELRYRRVSFTSRTAHYERAAMLSGDHL